MVARKYEITAQTQTLADGTVLHRIRACMDFPVVGGRTVHVGDLGGWIEKEENLAQHGRSWVADDAIVCGKAEIIGNAIVRDCAAVYGKAQVGMSAKVCDHATVCGKAVIYGKAKVMNSSFVEDFAKVLGKAKIYGGHIYGNAKVFGNAEVFNRVQIYDDAEVFGNATVSGDAEICGDARVSGNACIDHGRIENGEHGSSPEPDSAVRATMPKRGPRP